MKAEIKGVQYRHYPGLFVLNDLSEAVDWLVSKEASLSFSRTGDFDGVVDVTTEHSVNGKDFRVATRSRMVSGMEVESIFSAIDNHEVRIKLHLGA